MKLLLVLIFTCFYNFIFAQQKNTTNWHFTVIDSATFKPISKASISINQKRFYNTNNLGSVDIDKALINSKDSIKVSCIGYKSQFIFPTIGTKYPDTIRLSRSVITLREIKVHSAVAKSIILGDVKKYYNWNRTTNPANAYAQYIPNIKKIDGTIMSIEYVVNNQLQGIEKPFRARLYTKMKDSITLDKELTSDSIIVYNPEKKKNIKVDVSKYHIQFPENGVIAIFETLPRSYYDNEEILYYGQIRIRTPGIDMDIKQRNWDMDQSKSNRITPYSMVGPVSDRWNLNTIYDQWYVYQDGNFAITITISEN